MVGDDQRTFVFFKYRLESLLPHAVARTSASSRRVGLGGRVSEEGLYGEVEVVLVRLHDTGRVGMAEDDRVRYEEDEDERTSGIRKRWTGGGLRGVGELLELLDGLLLVVS